MPDHTWSWVARYIDTESYPGAMTDRRLARLLGVNHQTVRAARVGQDILNAPDRRELALARLIRNEDKRRPLSDVQLAKRLGKGEDTVRGVRLRLGFGSRLERRQAAERG